MNRREAISIVKKIQDEIPELIPKMVTVTNAQDGTRSSRGCIICFRGLNDKSKLQIREIIKAHSLISEESEFDLNVFSMTDMAINTMII